MSYLFGESHLKRNRGEDHIATDKITLYYVCTQKKQV